MVTLVILLLILATLNAKLIQIKLQGFIFVEDIYEPLTYIIYGIIGLIPLLNLGLLILLVLSPIDVFIAAMYEAQLIRKQNRDERRGNTHEPHYPIVNYKIKTKDGKRS